MDNFLYLPRALAASLFDLAFASSFGALLSLFWLGTPFLPVATTLRRVLTLSVATMALTLPVLLWLLTATMIASSSTSDIRPQLWEVLTGTHAGRILIPDFFCVLLVLLVTPLMRRRLGVYLGLGLIILLSAFRSASGHAAANGNMSLAEALQFFHLTATATWAGVIIIGALIVLPRLPDLNDLTRFSHSLSRAATVAIAIVALSGVYNAWLGLDGSLKPLPHTEWGLILLAKSALVLASLALGARNRSTLRRNPIFLSADARTFSRSMRLEAVAMVAILTLSGFLANSPPANGN